MQIPNLKNNGLDQEGPTNYRPIANVSFLSNIIEKTMAYQLTGHLERNNLLPSCQSGFRRFHSTETLLLRFLSDIYMAIDRSELTSLAFVNVNTAFDTVDHDILYLSN